MSPSQNTRKRKREEEEDQDDEDVVDTKMPANQRQQPQVLDPTLCALLPRSVVEKHLMPFITHVFTS
eukprot:CAMPEP_0194032210 /NCGR_PEP_ID=MMETSP0009_2-20130614/5195_1 /TAXON_ID=210454 /ORGANISM="Grammatophora oceanica, Strain CCMP 410" /LENGTH=66 /DNA_ID=CAMNT_0038672573 /DNA_START=38 /DNA_END=234 /DNA_ORIENTATION=-